MNGSIQEILPENKRQRIVVGCSTLKTTEVVDRGKRVLLYRLSVVFNLLIRNESKDPHKEIFKSIKGDHNKNTTTEK